MASQMANDISCRLGHFIELVNPGPHKDKRIAQRLDISVGMAKLLRGGQGWTAARIGQVWGIYGRDFVSYVFDGRPMSAVDADLEAIKLDLAILKARLKVDDHENLGRADASLPPMASAAELETRNLARDARGILESAPVARRK